MRVLHGRKRNPKLRPATAEKIRRREAKIARLREREGSETLQRILIAAVNREIEALIRTDTELFDHGLGSLRAKTAARLDAKPRRIDGRTREARLAKAQRAAESPAEKAARELAEVDAMRARVGLPPVASEPAPQ